MFHSKGLMYLQSAQRHIPDQTNHLIQQTPAQPSSKKPCRHELCLCLPLFRNAPNQPNPHPNIWLLLNIYCVCACLYPHVPFKTRSPVLPPQAA